jgi:predicted RecA/RadA family phage recombinase
MTSVSRPPISAARTKTTALRRADRLDDEPRAGAATTVAPAQSFLIPFTRGAQRARPQIERSIQMKNWIQKGKAIDIPSTPSGGYTAGMFYFYGAIAGVAALTSLVGEPNVLHREGVYQLPKATSEAWTIGQPLYWDVSAGKFTTTAAENVAAGVAVEAALEADTTGKVLLTPPGSGGLTVVAGQLTTVSATDIVVTGLSQVLAVVAGYETDPADPNSYVSAQIGDQAGSPAAGSIVVKTWKTTGSDPTPVAADAFGKKVNWIAVGIA